MKAIKQMVGQQDAAAQLALFEKTLGAPTHHIEGEPSMFLRVLFVTKLCQSPREPEPRKGPRQSVAAMSLLVKVDGAFEMPPRVGVAMQAGQTRARARMQSSESLRVGLGLL